MEGALPATPAETSCLVFLGGVEKLDSLSEIPAGLVVFGAVCCKAHLPQSPDLCREAPGRPRVRGWALTAGSAPSHFLPRGACFKGPWKQGAEEASNGAEAKEWLPSGQMTSIRGAARQEFPFLGQPSIWEQSGAGVSLVNAK